MKIEKQFLKSFIKTLKFLLESTSSDIAITFLSLLKYIFRTQSLMETSYKVLSSFTDIESHLFMILSNTSSWLDIAYELPRCRASRFPSMLASPLS